jgi:hypothetical protein
MREFRPLYEYPTNTLIEHLESLGYVVRHKGEAKRVIRFSRSQSFPGGLDSKQEALDRIRNQIDLDDIEHLTRYLVCRTRCRPQR